MLRAIPTSRSRLAWISSLAALLVAVVSGFGGLFFRASSRGARRVAGSAGVLRLGR